MAFVCKHPPLPKTGTHPTWVTETEPKGLPPFTECVARAIYASGGGKGDVSAAVRDAMGRVEDWAQGRHGAKPETVAKARADVVILKAKLAQTKGKRAMSLSAAYGEAIDLATAVTTARSAQPVTMNALADVVSEVRRLKRHPKLKYLPNAQLHRIAAARVAVRKRKASA